MEKTVVVTEAALEQKRAYHREYQKRRRAADPERAKRESHEWYVSTRERRGIKPRPETPCTAYELQKRHRENHPDRARARDIVNKRIKRGTLEKPTNCQFCGSTERVEAHHDNYGKPVDVLWLCKDCHWKRHLVLSKSVTREQNM